MQAGGEMGSLALLCVLLLPAPVFGDESPDGDSLAMVVFMARYGQGSSPVLFKLEQNADYSCTLTTMQFYNWQHGGNDSFVSFSHSFKYWSKAAAGRKITITSSFSHELGIQCLIDSLVQFQPDENRLETRIEARIWKTISFAAWSLATTRIFNSYLYRTSPAGNIQKVPNGSFLTPLQLNFSAGVNATLPQAGSFNLGLSSAKLTWICSDGIFDRPDATSFYGVPKGKRYLFEYGIGIRILVDKQFRERIRWNCELHIFKNYRKSADLEFRNQVSVKIARFLKLSLLTHLFYENDISKKVQVGNHFSAGFFVSL